MTTVNGLCSPERQRWRPGGVRYLCCCAVALAVVGALVIHATPCAAQDNGGEDGDTRKTAAKNLFALALDAFKARKYREALQKLEEVYRLDPHPIILYNMGRSHEELGELAEAASYFRRAVADDRLPRDLQAEIGTRLPKVLPALERREARNVADRVVVSSIVRADDSAREAFVSRRNSDDKKGAVREARWVPGPLFWTGTATTVAGVATLVGGLVVDLGLSSDIDELKRTETRRDAERTRQLQEDIDSGQTLATILYASGGAVLITGGVLMWLSLTGESGESASTSRATGFDVHLTPGGAAFTVSGSFDGL